MLASMILRWANCEFPFPYNLIIFSALRNGKAIFYVLLMSIPNAWFSCGNRLSSDGQDFFTSYDEVFESFDAMGLQENLLRGIYAYGV